MPHLQHRRDDGIRYVLLAFLVAIIRGRSAFFVIPLAVISTYVGYREVFEPSAEKRLG